VDGVVARLKTAPFQSCPLLGLCGGGDAHSVEGGGEVFGEGLLGWVG
jgi:hypothetical protein